MTNPAWATAANLLRISEEARAATGWTWGEQEARDYALGRLPTYQKLLVLNHLLSIGLEPLGRPYQTDNHDVYAATVEAEFKREMSRWQAMRDWIAENVGEPDHA